MLRMDYNQEGSTCAVVLLLYVLLYYMGRRHNSCSLYMVLVLLEIWRLLMIPAFGEILRRWCAKASASPSLSSTHFGLQRHQGAKVANRSAAVGKSAYGLVTHLAGSIMLLYVGRAATEEQVNNGSRYARQTSAGPRQTRILYAPIPGGEMNGQAPPFDSTTVPVRRAINIIYRDCITGRLTPPVFASHTI